MNPEILATLLSALIVAAISLIFYFQSRGHAASVAYAVFVLSAAFWGMGVSAFLVISDPFWSDFFARFLYFFGGFIAPSFYFFARTFTSEKTLPAPKILGLFIFPFVLFVLYFFTDYIIKGYTFTHQGVKGFVYGPWHLLFDIQLWIYFISALVDLGKKYIGASDRKLKTHILYVMLGTYIVLSIATITNVFAPLLGIFQYIWIGPASTIIWVILITYAITVHRLLNARLIATEIFVAIITIILIVETSLSQNNSELIRKIILLIGSSVFSYLLIRGVMREAEQRDKLEALTRDLEHANTELKKLDQAKSEFISIASHQLRTPLTVIRGYSSMLSEGTFGRLSSKSLEVISKITTSAENLIGLVADLLNLSRMESGRFHYDKEGFDIADIVKDVVDKLRLNAEAKGLKITFENKFGAHAVCVCDKDKIREVFTNLVDNAIKYTASGEIKVLLEREERDGIILFKASVSDRGIGIRPEDIPRLFIKFNRMIEGQKIDPNGLGLGLYFVRRVVEDHNGKVWVESEGLGKGSKFIVELALNNDIGR